MVVKCAAGLGSIVFLLCLSWSPTALAQAQTGDAARAEAVSHDAASRDAASRDATSARTSTRTDVFARDTFRIEPVVCPFKGKIEYEPGDIECAFLQVPENREVADSRFIDLHFVKLNSTWDDDEAAERTGDDSGLAPGKRDDPVIYLTGGPGATVTGYVERFKDHGIRKHRDLYILEQRGIGASSDFCPFYSQRNPALTDVETFEASLDASIETGRNCAEVAKAAGVDLRGYNTIENARDVHALRRALGFDQWNVWGISYGSILGQAYLKEDPEGIRAVVLDAIMPLDARDETTHWRVASWYDRVLKKLEEACQADSTCASRYPDLGQRVRDAAQAFVDAPMVVEVEDVETFPSGEARFFQDIAAMLPFAFFYEQDNYPGLPGVIYAWADAVERRDPTPFKGLAAAFSSGNIIEISQGMSDAIMCLDGYIDGQRASALADLEARPVLAQALTSTLTVDKAAKVCRELGLPPRPAKDYSRVETDIPALIVEGEMDPITPPPLAKAILPGFKNGTYVEFPYAGHGPSRSVKCAGDMLNKFFDEPSAKPDLSCAEQMKAPDFFWLYRSNVAPLLLSMMVEEKKALAGPAAWGFGSVLILLVAFVVLTFGPLGRLLDGMAAAKTSGARWAAWLAATLGVAAVATLGAGIGMTYAMSKLMVFFGFLGWARMGAIAGTLAGVLGLLTIGLAVRSRARDKLPLGTTLGFVVTGIAALSLSVFLFAWDLGPF